MICPACGSKEVHRSHRKWYERPMRLIGVRPYRCSDCRHRFFSGPSPSAKKKKEPVESR